MRPAALRTQSSGSPAPQRNGRHLAHAGVRNTVGFDFHPDTGVPYFTDNGRDRE